MNVLLVEDEANTLDVYSRLLELDGHVVTATEDVESASRAIESSCFDVAVIDVALGTADGFAVLDLLKRRQPEARAVLITAYDVPETSLRAAARGADDFLAKPLSWADLRRALGRAVRQNDRRTAG
ncbi:MAG: response regulator [Acidobacteriota bacterium]